MSPKVLKFCCENGNTDCLLTAENSHSNHTRDTSYVLLQQTHHRYQHMLAFTHKLRMQRAKNMILKFHEFILHQDIIYKTLIAYLITILMNTYTTRGNEIKWI